MSSKDVTLIIVSGGDIASTNQADFLLQKFDWKVIAKVEGLDAYSYQEIRMWIHPGGVLFEDDDGLLNEDMMIQMYLKKIRCIILLQSIFEKYGIKYLMYNGHDYYGSEVGFEYPDFLRVVSVRQNNSITSKLHLNLIEKIDNSFFLSKQVVDIFGENQIQNYYKGHGDKKGHKIFADYLIKEINKI